jgi:hypothetical protein
MAEIEVAAVAVGVSGQMQPFEVVIDGETRGHVATGETRLFSVVPGIHTVRLATGRNSPPPVKVVVFGTTSLLCQTKNRLRFGLFPVGEPETQIVVRERDEMPVIAWKGPERGMEVAELFGAD